MRAEGTMNPTPTFGSLFTGIGGFDLGLERAGLHCCWQVEIDDNCQAVLARHWPHVPRHRDIKDFDARDAATVDVVVGGFPCQDISRAGRRAGLDGAKSGLWSEMRRVIDDADPTYVLVENSTSLINHGLPEVLGDLDALGFDAEWSCLPAAAFGAPHIRDRLYLLAYTRSGRCRPQDEAVFAGWTGAQLHGGWTAEPCVGRVADGLPRELDRTRRARIRALGNAVVPHIAEWLAERIVEDAAMAYDRQEIA